MKLLVAAILMCSLALIAETGWGECETTRREMKMYSELMTGVENKAPKGKKKGTILLKGAQLRQYCMLTRQMKSAAAALRIWCNSVSDKRLATTTEMSMIEILSTTCRGVW